MRVFRRVRRAMEHRPAHWFVEYFDAVQGRFVAVSASQSLQHVQRVLHQVRILRPFAHARQTAVVETVLRFGNGMQVDHDLQSRLPRPAERTVEVRDAARMSGPVAEDEIRYGNAYEVDSVTDDNTEILQGDVGFAVPAQFLGEIPFGPEGYVRAVHPDFIVFGAAGERFRIHPFLQHQPVAEVHAVDSLVDA